MFKYICRKCQNKKFSATDYRRCECGGQLLKAKIVKQDLMLDLAEDE